MAIAPVIGSVVNQLVSSLALDVTGVYTQTFVQVFRAARPLKLSITPKQKLMEHPLETGATSVDHKVIQSTEIEMSMIIPHFQYRNTLAEIKQLWTDGTLLIVQTKSDTYNNMLIEAYPNEESSDMYNAITVALKLKQVQFATTTLKIVPRNPVNSSTVERGTQTTTELPETSVKTSALQEKFGGYFK